MSKQSEPTPFAGDVANYTLEAFADELRTQLAPAGIEMRLDESEDGTRTVSAWRSETPGAESVFPIDDIRILPYQADIVATTIRRSFAQPGTAERAPDQPAVEGAPSE